MSLHYLLDGYNITHRNSTLALKKLEDSRASLIQLIEKYQPQGSSKNTVTIVFDGQPDVFGGEGSSSVKVIFTKNESADDKIKKIVQNAQHPKQIVVVTDDKDIKFFVRSLGAKVISVADFLKKAQSTASNPTLGESQKQREQKRISRVEGDKITSEMKEIWLKKKTR